MEVKIITDEKEDLKVELENQTVAELLRVYLGKESGVEMAAWRREHPNKPITFQIKTKGKSAKKALDDAIKAIEKDTDKYIEEFKKAIK